MFIQILVIGRVVRPEGDLADIEHGEDELDLADDRGALLVLLLQMIVLKDYSIICNTKNYIYIYRYIYLYIHTYIHNIMMCIETQY